MSQEDYRRGLQDVPERLRDQGRLDAIPRSDHQVKQLLEHAYTNVERTRFLLKHALDDFDQQAIPADIGARYDFPRDARRTRPRSMPRARPLRYGAMRSSSFGEAAAAAGTLE